MKRPSREQRNRREWRSRADQSIRGDDERDSEPKQFAQNGTTETRETREEKTQISSRRVEIGASGSARRSGPFALCDADARGNLSVRSMSWALCLSASSLSALLILRLSLCPRSLVMLVAPTLLPMSVLELPVMGVDVSCVVVVAECEPDMPIFSAAALAVS